MEDFIDEYSFKKFLNQFLRKQSKEARVFFVRRYWYGDSIKQIAAENKVREEKVKTSLFRTRNKLKLAMQKEGISL